jgi:hypothetical protein
MNSTISNFVIPAVILFIAISIAIGYKFLNRSASWNDPIEQECIKVSEEEIKKIAENYVAK